MEFFVDVSCCACEPMKNSSVCCVCQLLLMDFRVDLQVGRILWCTSDGSEGMMVALAAFCVVG